MRKELGQTHVLVSSPATVVYPEEPRLLRERAPPPPGEVVEAQVPGWVR